MLIGRKPNRVNDVAVVGAAVRDDQDDEAGDDGPAGRDGRVNKEERISERQVVLRPGVVDGKFVCGAHMFPAVSPSGWLPSSSSSRPSSSPISIRLDMARANGSQRPNFPLSAIITIKNNEGRRKILLVG